MDLVEAAAPVKDRLVAEAREGAILGVLVVLVVVSFALSWSMEKAENWRMRWKQ